MYISPRLIEKAYQVASIMALVVFVSAFTFLFPTKTLAYYNTDQIVNGTFSLGSYGWYDSYGAIGFDSALIGRNTVYDSISQNFSVPTGATVTLSFESSVWTNYDCEPSGMCWSGQNSGTFFVRIIEQGTGIKLYERGCYVGNARTDCPGNMTADVSSIAGKNVSITFSVTGNNGYRVTALIDNVHVVTDVPDTTPPTTTAIVSPPTPNGTNGWFQSIPTITLSAKDDTGGSGLVTTAFDIDGVNGQYYSSSFALSAGVHTINFASIDAENNIESKKSLIVKTDLDDPTVTVTGPTTPDGSDGWFRTQPVIAVSGTDGTSGIGGYQYNIDVGAWLNTTNTIPVPDGIHTISVRSVDVSGRVSASSSLSYKVNTTPPTPVVVAPIPTPQVLGATTFHPVVKTLKLTKGIYSYKLNGKTVNIRPFGTDYKGTVWARSVDFGPDGKLYVFINSGAYKKGQIKVFKADGKPLKAYNPYGGFATNGLNATTLVESNDFVYMAVGTTKAGTTVKTYQVTAKGLKTLISLAASIKQGNILVGFQKVYKSSYGLVTMRKYYPSTLKVWKLDPKTNKFVEDKKINKNNIKL